MAPALTEGILAKLAVADPKDAIWDTTPVLQFLSIKLVSMPNAAAPSGDSERPDRYRIIVSDGRNFLQAMLATQLNDMVIANLIGKNTIGTIEKMVCNNIGGKRLVVILGLRVEELSPPKVGDPRPLAAANEAASPAPATPTSMGAPSSSANSHTAAARFNAPPRHGQSARSGKQDTLYPIEALSPYQNNWTIKARVTQKSEVRTYSNQRGDGRLFNVTFMDESGDIKGTAFNAACDELYDKVQEGKVYYVSKARVDIAKKKFSNNQYELSLNVGTEIEEVTDAAAAPAIKYNFVALQDLTNIEKDQMCDVLAVVKEIGEVGSITTKAGKSLTKRELSLVDQSNFAVRLTLWGKQAEQFQASEQDVIAFKGVKVGDFGGRSLSMMSSSLMEVNLDSPQAHSLKGWYMDGGADSNFQAFSGVAGSGGGRSDQMRTIADAKAYTADVQDKAEYFSIRATIMNIKPDNMSYPACPSATCNKKVTEESGGWRCEKCEKTFPAPEYRYIISMAVADMTDEIWLQGFNDAGNIVLGKTANELTEIREQDEGAFNLHMASASGKAYVFTVRAKQDTYNDRTRVRYGIIRIENVDYTSEINNCLALLNSSWAQ